MGKKYNAQDHYWQTSLLNSVTYQMYRNWILTLMTNRFRWVGLPDTCDERYLEVTLALEGVATIARPTDGIPAWVSTKATSGRLNIYDNPTEWDSTGNNGWSFHVTPLNGVLVWDNRLRVSHYDLVHAYALRLAEYDRVLDVNLQQQKVPWFITGPQEKRLDMVNLLKQALGGEPAVIGMKGIETIDWNALPLSTEFIGEEIQTAKARTWNELYTALGIPNVDSKQERMIEAEVKNSDDPTDIMALDGLQARRQAADYLNDTFGMNVGVYWNRDIESQNFNYMANIKEQEEVANDGDTDSGDGRDI